MHHAAKRISNICIMQVKGIVSLPATSPLNMDQQLVKKITTYSRSETDRGNYVKKQKSYC